MRDSYLIGFLLLLPVFAVLGHDIYMAYNNTELEAIDRFWLSDLGWLWVKYHPDTYNWAIENTDKIIWDGIIDPMLAMPAIITAAVPFLIFLAITLVMRVFGLGPYEGHGLVAWAALHNAKRRKKSDFSFSGGGKESKRVKYKRK